MGNDGGSIPKRRELVKEANRAPTLAELKATALESLGHAWTYCPLSDERLDLATAVSDWRGRLYNYESVLRGLVPRGRSGDGEGDDKNERAKIDGGEKGQEQELNGNGDHSTPFAATGIRSIRDVVRLKFKSIPSDSTTSERDPYGEKKIWACPVSLKELGTSTKAVYLVPCGHVFADVAIREILSGSNGGNSGKTGGNHGDGGGAQTLSCPECSESFAEDDVIPILSTDDAELKRLSTRIERLRAAGLAHSLKKDKNRKRKAAAAADTREKTGGGEAPPPSKTARFDTKTGTSSSRVSGSINNPATAALTAKVMAEQEERNKRRRLAAAKG